MTVITLNNEDVYNFSNENRYLKTIKAYKDEKFHEITNYKDIFNMLKPLNDVRNLKDPLKQFVCNMSIAFPAGSQLAQFIDTEDLILRATSYSMPGFKADETVVTWSGFERHYGGKQTRQGSWSCTIVEVWDARILEIFKRWFNAYHNYKNGTISLLDQYTGIVNIALVNPDLYEPKPDGIRSYDLRLYDVFPVSCDLPTIDASSSEKIDINLSLNYNYFLAGDEIDGN